MEVMSLDTILEQAKGMKGYILASLTDRYIVDEWPSSDKLFTDNAFRRELNKKLLEIRIFNKAQEIKVFRSDVSQELLCRTKTETGTEDFFDEWQYLDIDSKKVVTAQRVTSTGGGEYKLPLRSKLDAKICIRYYLGRYPETGQAYIQDWRCVCFKEVR